LTIALQLDPTDINAYTARAAAYEKLNFVSQAIADYRKALTIDRRNQLAASRLKELGLSP